MITLGSRVRDKTTGFIGNATSRVEYLTGAPRVGVESVDGQGRAQHDYFDEERLEEVS